MKIETKLKKLGFKHSHIEDQWYNDQLDVNVYVDSEGKITDIQLYKSWYLGSKSYSAYGNYSNRDEYLIKVMHLLEEINRML